MTPAPEATMSEAVHLLLVDDDDFSLLTLESLLAIHGYQLSLCRNGTEALEFVKHTIPDAILLDLMMPDIDGIEVCRRIRKNPATADIPLIMVSAIDERQLRIAALEAGMDDFLQKPYDRLELEARVRSITNLNRLRRQRQMELRQERDRTKAILNALGEGVIVTDNAGNAEFANPIAGALTGYSPEELIGQPNAIWRYANFTATEVELVNHQINSGAPWRGELVNRRKDGAYYHTALTVAPILKRSYSNKPTGSVAIFRDITEIKEAQRLKEEFISNVSHELRTPLSIITLLSGNLDKGYDRLVDEQRKDIISDIREQAQILRELIDSVLSLMAMDNHQETALELVDLTAAASKEIAKNQPLAKAKRHQLCFQSASPLFISINEPHLQQIIRNLISNAIKYTPLNGKIELQCRQCNPTMANAPPLPGINQLPAGEWAALLVQDNGIGINVDQLPYIFGRFYRANASAAEPGAGLGLSIAKELIEQYNGHIFVESQEKVGSTFALYFPLQPSKGQMP